MTTLFLRPGRDKPVRQRHPWIFSGALAHSEGNPSDGGVVDVRSAEGEWLARGTWSGASQLCVRLITWDVDEPIDAALLRRRLQRALQARQLLPGPQPAAQRLVFSEADGLPGLVVDRYAGYLVVQILTQGMERRRETLIGLLNELLAPRGIFERSDDEMRTREGLPPGSGLLAGEAPPPELLIDDAGLLMGVDLQGGQKTGFYLDQALNRPLVAALCHGQEVLGGFSYTGGFELQALRYGASHVTAIDSSASAIAQLEQNALRNRLETQRLSVIEGDVFRLLRQYRAEDRRFDVVILDPPKFAHSQAQLERATRGYKDINLIACQILRPGGMLATFSCSGLVSADLFQKILFGAALDARRDLQVLARLTQAPDHPVLLSFPESEYLKGLVCRVW